MSARDNELEQGVVLLDFSLGSIRRPKPPTAAEAAPDFLPTRRYLEGEPPGITTADRVLRKLVEACESVRDDIARQGILSYESLHLVRAALDLAGK